MVKKTVKNTTRDGGTGIARVAVIGTGTIGSSWAAFYASCGLRVRLYDSLPAVGRRGQDRAHQFLKGMAEQGLIPKTRVTASFKRLTLCETLADAVCDADIVQESIVENYEAKQALFKAMEAWAPRTTILASSSSGLLMSRIQQSTRFPGRCVVAHPFNPPHLMPLVELVPGRQTAPATVRRMKRFFEALGKVPVILKKEMPGHIANRLQAAIWREATDLVLQGVASVEDVDKALYAGPGPRWAFMGQHLTFHLGGGDGGYAHFIQHLHDTFRSCWDSMATWTALPEGSDKVLLNGVKKMTRNRPMDELRAWRDATVAGVLKAAGGRERRHQKSPR